MERLVLVGDAGLKIGEIAQALSPIAPVDACRRPAPTSAPLTEAAALQQVPILAPLRKVLSERHPTALVWLGDNVYERGIPESMKVSDLWDDDGSLRPNAKADPEFPSFAALHVEVDASALADRAVFIPGNHDWDSRVSPSAHGSQRVAAEARVISELACRVAAPSPEAITLAPTAGCPGPTRVRLPLGAVDLVALDTESLLQEMQGRPRAPGCADEAGFFAALDAMLTESTRPVLVVGHHPLSSYGPHGGFNGNGPFGWLQSAVRWIVRNDEDLRGRHNQRMVRRLREVLTAHRSNVLAYASGHEHSLQLIRRAPDAIWELGSGAGSKRTPVRYGPGTLYAVPDSGFMYVDFAETGAATLNIVSTNGGALVTRQKVLRPSGGS